jgi:hypothetical protein
MDKFMDKLLLRIILIKEALDHKYLNYEYYLEYYDKNLSYIIDNEDKLNALLLQSIYKYPNEKILKYFDIPEIRYLYLDSRHDSSIYDIDYSSNILDLYLDNKSALSWPDNMNNKMMIRFYGVYDINLNKIPKWWVYHQLIIEDDLSLSITADKKEVKFSFSKLEFISI